MAYNKYFLRHILRAWTEIWDLSLQSLLETIITHILQAPKNTVLHKLSNVFERYIQSIMKEQAYLLPYPDMGERPWELDESLSLVVLLHTKEFYSELAPILSSLLPREEHPRLRELLRFQEASIPQHQKPTTQQRFAWNWKRYTQGKNLSQQSILLSFQQPFYVHIPDPVLFAHTYLNLMQSRSISTQQAQQIMVEANELSLAKQQVYVETRSSDAWT